MIVTVTLDPCLDVRYDVPALTLGEVNRVTAVRQRAGGRGLTVARLLSAFGHDVVAAGLAGGSAGEAIRGDLARAGVPVAFTSIAAESRRLVRVTGADDGLVTGFDEPAPYITTEELGRLAADYRGLLDGATAVVLCGGLPAGLPAEIYGSLISYASAAGVPVVLNAGGASLRHGVARGPALVIPELGPGELPPAPDARGALALMTGGGVCVRTQDGEWRADAGSVALPDGAAAPWFTDALVAGFVPGIALGWTWPDTLRHALALAGSGGPSGDTDFGRYERLLPAVRIGTGTPPAA